MERDRTSAAKILIVDDEADVREVLAEYLVSQGFDVLEAANGLEALLHVKRARPAGVVLDLRMPRLGGIEALKRIRAFDPAIAVVVVTAYLDPEADREARRLGTRAVLSKPVHLPDVLAALRGDVPSAPDSARLVSPAAAVASAAGTPRDSTARVLVVDDDPAVREMLEEFLVRNGHRVSSAGDGVAAVRAIAESPPDIVLLDVDMPGLKGTDALPTIRALAPRTAVIMVSGIADAELAKRSLAHGAFDYVVKPIDLTYLTQSLETALAMRALAPE